MEKYREIEKSIIKKYRKEIWSRFVKAIKEYKLIKENDKIAVCISGGKDSFLLAKCLEELKRHGQFKFDLEYLVMDPGYNEEILNKIYENARIMNINFNLFKSDIFEVSSKSLGDNPCYLCARMRRGYLYNKAKELGCNKIALGHHFNDVIETIMLNMIFNGQFSSMMPKLRSDNFEGMELIRPLYFVFEKDIISWSKYNNLEFIGCACTVTKKGLGRRKEVKELIEKLKQINPNIDLNIFKSTCNVNLNTMISYFKDSKEYIFLDDYDE